MKCVGLSGHVEVDNDAGQSSMGETSPNFQDVPEMLDWARARAGEIVLRVGLGRTPSFWEGPGEVPLDVVAMDALEASAQFRRFLEEFPSEYFDE